MLEDLMKNAGGVAQLVQKNPQIVAAVVSLLSSKDTSVGGSAGLGGLMGQFQQAGLGNLMQSWVSKGPNPPISEQQLSSVLGNDVLSQFAARAGLPAGQGGSVLASLLPSVIDQLTPDGTVPPQNSLEGSLGSLLGMLGR
jgi:uncharacterized protein YidB (DUF937 family)